MWIKAQGHRGLYLLPQRPRAELMKAARWLIDNGFARLLPYSSDYSPGIRLTGKPGPY